MYVMGYFADLLMALGFVIFPVIYLTYLKFRLPARRNQLTSFFKSEDILPAYLAMRGHKPSKRADEHVEAYHQRLADEFDRVFSLELAQEYGLALYLVPIAAACLTTAIVVFFLLSEAAGHHLITNVPRPVSYALLGAFAGNLYINISRYSLTDLSPTALWWVTFRYLIATAYGLFASMIFSEALAGLGSFVLGMIQISEALQFLRTRIGLVRTNDQDSGFHFIQGLDTSTIDMLADLGVSHAQHLAYIDPLKLLLRSNFSPGELADWMDQCFLLNYVGSKIETLRTVGIRGGIEVADLDDLEPEKKSRMVAALAVRLGINDAEANNLVEEMAIDAQLELIDRIWGSVDVSESSAESQT